MSDQYQETEANKREERNKLAYRISYSIMCGVGGAIDGAVAGLIIDCLRNPKDERTFLATIIGASVGGLAGAVFGWKKGPEEYASEKAKQDYIRKCVSPRGSNWDDL